MRKILTDEEVVRVVELYNLGTVTREISRETGVNSSSIPMLLKNLRKAGAVIPQRKKQHRDWKKLVEIINNK